MASAIMTITSLPTIAFADPAHCDRTGYPSCYDLGQAAGHSAGSSDCPSGHSHNYCVGREDAKNGVNGNDIDCENQDQPVGVAGCPNDK